MNTNGRFIVVRWYRFLKNYFVVSEKVNIYQSRYLFSKPNKVKLGTSDNDWIDMRPSKRCNLDESRAPTENCAREKLRLTQPPVAWSTADPWPSGGGGGVKLWVRTNISRVSHSPETSGPATRQTIRGIRWNCDSRETIVGSTLEFNPVIFLFCWLIVDSSLPWRQTLPLDTYQAILGKITFKDPKIK